MNNTLLGALNKIAQLLTDNKVAIGFEQITVSSTATPLTRVPDNTTSVLITVENNSIRFQENGTPTTTTGHLREVGTAFEIDTAQNVSSLLLIATGADAIINVTYYNH